MKTKPTTTEDWLEAIFPLLERIEAKLDRVLKPSLADMGLINTRDLCEMLEVSAKTVAGWRKDGTLRFTQKGARYYYLLTDVRQMLYDGFNRK